MVAGCSSLLPKTTETTADAGNAWRSYRDAEQTFDTIVPGKTTVAELRGMKLDPASNPNITILHHFEVRRKFMVNQLVTLDDLDAGVRECIAAKADCRAWEINQTSTQKKRTGNAALDMSKIYRETHTSGWRFNGLLLINGGVVVYKLTGGQPLIHEVAENKDVLAPLQAISGKLHAINGIGNDRKATDTTPVEPVTAIKIKR